MPAEDTRHPERQLNCLQKEVGQNIEDKETKELGTEIRPGEGVIKEKFPNTRKSSHQGGLWGVLESQRAT